ERETGGDAWPQAPRRQQRQQLGLVSLPQVRAIGGEGPLVEAEHRHALEQDEVERDPGDLARGESDHDEARAPRQRTHRPLAVRDRARDRSAPRSVDRAGDSEPPAWPSAPSRRELPQARTPGGGTWAFRAASLVLHRLEGSDRPAEPPRGSWRARPPG